MSSSANSALNVLILGHSHIYWLVEHVRTGNLTGLFTDFWLRDRSYTLLLEIAYSDTLMAVPVSHVLPKHLLSVLAGVR